MTDLRNVWETPEAFERQICRIKELLERSHEHVTWNDHVPDPDNPIQARQIDIAIRRDGRLTIVECRLRRRRQGVQWIEELHGKRQSLGAQTIIAVASAGFTDGAKKKASRFGVVLRDLQQLSDEEIAGWGAQVTVMMYYYQYSDVKLAVGFAPSSLTNIDLSVLNEELRSHGVLDDAFDNAAAQLDKRNLLARNDTQTFPFCVLCRPERVDLCGEPVLEIQLEGRARLVTQPITSREVIGYGEPTLAATQRKATVEKFNLGETSIVHDDDRIAIEIDLSKVALPPLSQIRAFRTTSTDEMGHESFAVKNPEKLRVTGPFRVDLYGIQP